MKHLFWIIPVGIIVLIGLWAWGFYNSVITASEGVDAQWAQVETDYQRRFDLIPNLVSSVKGAMAQEQKVFGDIAEATIDQKAEAAGQVESALSRLLVVMENYPDLKSNQNVKDLMVSLEGSENRISVQRIRFNDLVREYNLKIKRFPGSVLASMFGFEVRKFFEAAEGAEKAPAVNLDVNLAPTTTPPVTTAPATTPVPAQ
jgi:LemA protein